MRERLAAVRAGLPKLPEKAREVADPVAAEAVRVASIGRQPFIGADAARRAKFAQRLREGLFG